MSKTLTIGSDTFDFPTNNQNPGWGEDVVDWAEKVSESLDDVTGTYDKLLSSFTILNNQSAFVSITGCIFDPTPATGPRSVTITYWVTRTTSTTTKKECGTLIAEYNGSDWVYINEKVGDGGIDLHMTAAGQVQYKSTNMSGTSYSGTFYYRAKTIDQN